MTRVERFDVIIYRDPDVLTTGRRVLLAKRKQASATKSRGSSRKARQPLTAREIQDAADRGREWLAERHDYHGYLARRDSARGAPELARHLQGDLRAKQGRDGSWAEGDLLASAESIWRLLDLGLAPDSPPIALGLDWLYRQRDQEGAEGSYSSGCTPSRHEQRICEHYVSGFFSPGPLDEPQEVTLPNGQVVTSDAGARLLSSERALRTVLRANPSDPRAASSISGLRSLPLYLEYGGSYTPALLVGAVQALAWTPGPYPGELKAAVELLAEEQEKDGGWPNVEFFFVLEALLEVRHPLSMILLGRAVPRLLETQHKSGDWGRRHQAAQTWIGVQVLGRVADSRVADSKNEGAS